MNEFYPGNAVSDVYGTLPSRELTYLYPPKKVTFEDDFPFPQVGYVSVPWRVTKKNTQIFSSYFLER